MIADRQPPPPFGAIPDRPLERPYVVGIAGGTGSGKTTVAELMEKTARSNGLKVMISDHELFSKQGKIPNPTKSMDIPNESNIDVSILVINDGSKNLRIEFSDHVNYNTLVNLFF